MSHLPMVTFSMGCLANAGAGGEQAQRLAHDHAGVRQLWQVCCERRTALQDTFEFVLQPGFDFGVSGEEGTRSR